MIDTPTDRPAYRRLADEIRALIEDGRPGPGEALPSEAALERQHGVGRDTVRDALTLLRSWDLVSPQHGRGWYVRDIPQRQPVRVSETIRISARMPTAAEQARWELEDGVPVLEVRRGDRIQVYPADRTQLEL